MPKNWTSATVKRAREQESGFKRTYTARLLSRRKIEKPRLRLALERGRGQSVRLGGLNPSQLAAPFQSSLQWEETQGLERDVWGKWLTESHLPVDMCSLGWTLTQHVQGWFCNLGQVA